MKLWSFEEEKYLLDNINESKIKDIANNLGKSESAIIQKLARLRISKEKKCMYPGIFWNKWDKKWIVYYYLDEIVWELGQYRELNEAKQALFMHKILIIPL